MRTLSLLTFSALSFTAALTAFSSGACSPYDPDLGDEPYQCAMTEPFCPSGYACNTGSAGNFCIREGATGVPDGGGGSGSDAFCNMDSQVEGPTRNDDIAHAFSSGVETSLPKIPFAGLVICPAGDKDNYAITLQTTGSIDLLATVTGGAPVQVNILNSGGTSIKNGTADNATTYHAHLDALPPGNYYAQAFATATATNKYSLTIAVTH